MEFLNNALNKLTLYRPATAGFLYLEKTNVINEQLS